MLFDNILYVFTQPLHNEQDVTKDQFLSRVKLVWIQFSFSSTSCHTKVKEPSLPNYLPIAGRRIVGFISLLVLYQMQTALSRIWTVSSSYDNDNNHISEQFCPGLNTACQVHFLWH